ncbi:MAG: carbohydrate kinase family protein [Chloroflexi bacterium]|nr:carbohydrate kinase family protein [Chloroflexota bacterium]MCI0580276.1 carbohydrate kinase family protein [Chloroflexota bacterium]MCI0643687.1 carbohydrate kinase family protein [Chloroflexota bacterium]MCI0729071.1 carbohydrate kinase family protein [Chloroflexota bacterium]
MSDAYDMVVMGDVNLDWYGRQLLSFPFSELVTNGVIEWMQLDEVPGGSGLNFARFAQEAGYRPLLLGKIGGDPAGRFIYEWLQQYGLETGISADTRFSTGKAFIVRDRNDIRFLVNNIPNANSELTVEDVEQFAVVLRSCRVLYISGYCLMNPEAPRTKAALRAMELAREGEQAHLVFDIVPHQFHKIYRLHEFRTLTDGVDVLISEVATMRRFLQLGDPGEVVTRAMAEEVVEHFSKFYNRLILRYGPSGCDEQIIWDSKNRELIWQETEHRLLQDKRGYGDKLALQVLRDVFRLAPAGL